jgi:hypothetical protein
MRAIRRWRAGGIGEKYEGSTGAEQAPLVILEMRGRKAEEPRRMPFT